MSTVQRTQEIWLLTPVTSLDDTDKFAVVKSPGGQNEGRSINWAALKALIPTGPGGTVPTPSERGIDKQIWISVRTDGKPGVGTTEDPFDGSTQAKFDALLSLYQSTNNLVVNLGIGTFQTDLNRTWFLKPGWRIIGAGKGKTIIQFIATTPVGTGEYFVLKTQSGVNSDDVVVQDLTVDCNWAGVANTATDGTDVRTITATTTNSSHTVTASDISGSDIGRRVTGDGIPDNTWIGSVVTNSAFTLSSSPVSDVHVNANASGTVTLHILEKNTKIGGVSINGSNGLVYRVRCENSYSSNSNGREMFDISIAGYDSTHLAANALISECETATPWGTYGSAYFLGQLIGGRVDSCVANGRNINGNGNSGETGNTGYTTGGVNLAYINNAVVSWSQFYDCGELVYQDTGWTDGVFVNDCRGVRLQAGVEFVQSAMSSGGLKNNINIARNTIGIIQRGGGQAKAGIGVYDGASTNVTIGINHITFDTNGGDSDGFHTVIINTITDGSINGIIGQDYAASVSNNTGFSLINNRTPDGLAISGMADNAFPTGMVDLSSLQTLSNKRVSPRVGTTSGVAPQLSPNADTQDVNTLSKTSGTTLQINKPSGTPTDGQLLTLRIYNHVGSDITATWNTAYKTTLGVVTGLPTTIVNAEIYVFQFMYNAGVDEWELLNPSDSYGS